MSSDFSETIGRFMLLSPAVIRPGADIVRIAQLDGDHAASLKADGTKLTATDKRSETAIVEALAEHLPGLPVWAEESGELSSKGPLIVLVDPLDGTKQLACGGAGSVVILALYNTAMKRVVACTIAEPCLERIWLASSVVKGCYRETAAFYRSTVEVWSGNLDSRSMVYVDISSGFAREGGSRPILDNSQARALWGELAQQCNVTTSWSNGFQQAMVANGEVGVAGAITTAIGGPWDVCGVLLVLQAGGAARAFRTTTEHIWEQVEDPLDVMSYDILIVGNNERTVATLSRAFLNAVAV